jgi:hypothetical protein
MQGFTIARLYNYNSDSSSLVGMKFLVQKMNLKSFAMAEVVSDQLPKI